MAKQPYTSDVEPFVLTYNASPTGKAFHRCDSKVRGILGPIGCLPSWTEVMTPGGWIFISQWSGEEILQWDSEKNECYFKKPKEHIVGDGAEFLNFKIGTKRNMTVTGNHRVPLFDWNKRFCVKSADDLARKLSKHTLPTTWQGSGEGVPMSDLDLRLWVAVAADGHYPKNGKQCVFGLRRERKIERLEKLLLDTGIMFNKVGTEREGTMEYNITFARPNFPKHLDWRLSCVNKHQAELIIEEARHWDGLHDNEYDRFDSTNRQDADIIQYLSHCAGRNTTLTSKRDPRNEEWAENYYVHTARIGSAKNKVCVRCDETEVEKITLDKQYCFETDTGFFVVRQDDFIFITGNSGKSSTCIMEIFIKACAQEPDTRGIRRTRWAVVRNTFPELITTTIDSFREWFREPICTYKADKPLSCKIKLPLGDGTKVECEVLFLACDRAEDAGKFRSLQITGVWVNEASQIKDKSIIDELDGRCGRYPKMWRDKDGKEVGGATWYGMIMDTNAPDDESWWYKTFEVVKPSNWKIFKQPPAVLLEPWSTPAKPVYAANKGQNPAILPAENVDHIGIGWKYYMEMIPGKPYEYIKVFLMAQYGTVSYGRPVYPEYNDMVHYAPNITKPDGSASDVEVYNGLPLFLGWDFGVQHSACMIAQLSPKGQLRYIEEILGENCGIRQFARELVSPHLRNTYPGCRIISTGDPAGNSRAQTDESTCLQILNEEGLPTQACVTNSPVARREAVRFFLSKMVNGESGLLVGSKCPTFRKGFLGRYCFKRLSSSTVGEAYSGEPLKDLFSHIHDAGQYIAVRIMSGDVAYNNASRLMSQQEGYPGVSMPGSTPDMIPQGMDMKGYF